MAYALIAGVDSRFGVYSAIDVTIVASIFGSSSHLINGPTSAISLLVFTALAFIDSENSKELFEALFLLAVLVGAFQIVISLFKLGNLTRYISESVIIGFMTAAAFLLAIGQLGNALGVRDKGNGHMQVLRRVWLTLTHGDHINYRALTLSVAAVILAVVLRKLVQRYGWPQVDMLAVLVITALIAYIARWSISGPGGHTAVSVAAKIPRSCPARMFRRSTRSGCRICPRVRWPSPSSASSRRCRSRKPLPIRHNSRSTTTARSWTKAWPT